jgi:hypothetical protein
VLDELYCKAFVIDNGKRRLALLVCDVLGLGRPICAAIRQAVTASTGIPSRDVMVCATHTHCGPDMDLLTDDDIDHLVAQAAGAAQAAIGSFRDARIGFGSGGCWAGVNRRNPRSPRIPYHLYSYPEGTMDPRALVLAVQDRGGHPLGALVNYACHPVSLGWNELGMSKDYVEFTCSVLKDAWGARAVPLFMQGCAANINPRWIYDKPDADPVLPPDWPDGLEDRLRETRRLGHMLGGEALKAASSIMRWEEDVTLDARLVEVHLPLRADLSRRLSEGEEESRPASRYPGLHQRLLQNAQELATDVQVLRIGKSLIVGLPGEIMVEYQMELRRKLESAFVLVSELSGDSIGYVATPASFTEGGYEPNAANVSSAAGDTLLRAVHDSVQAMAAAG